MSTKHILQSVHRIFHSQLTLNPFLTKLVKCHLYPLCSRPLIYTVAFIRCCPQHRGWQWLSSQPANRKQYPCGMAHRWTHGCSRRTWPRDHFGLGPIDVCHGWGKISYVTAEVQYINKKVPFPNGKPMTFAIRPCSQSNYK